MDTGPKLPDRKMNSEQASERLARSMILLGSLPVLAICGLSMFIVDVCFWTADKCRKYAA